LIQVNFKVPHVGWNNIYNLKSKLTEGLKENAFMYFVHSYYAEISTYTVAECDYVQPFSAMLHKENFYAAQFHTEISGKKDRRLLRIFESIDFETLGLEDFRI